MGTPNNNQINAPDYYKLPGEGYLEDYIDWRGLSFAWGNALKYIWRAGHKDGEAEAKDKAKAGHYISFIAKRTNTSESECWATLFYLEAAAKHWYKRPNGGVQ